MATRGAIARLTHLSPLKWAGCYHHRDSYPSGLGSTLWEMYNGHFNRDLDLMLRVLLDEHPAGWSSLDPSDFERPALDLEPEPHPIEPAGAADAETEPHHLACYCHGERQENEWLVTDKDAAALGCEWAYVFTSTATSTEATRASATSLVDATTSASATTDATYEERHNMMLVLSSHTPRGKMIGMFGQGDPRASWPVVAVVDLNGTEPHWERIKKVRPPDPVFPFTNNTHRKAGAGSPLVRRDWGRHGTYVVRLTHEAPHYVFIQTEANEAQRIFCTCSAEEEAESPDCRHVQAVLHQLQAQRDKAKVRREQGLEYSGLRVRTGMDCTGEGSAGAPRTEAMVLAAEAGWPRLLDPKPSQHLRNHSPCGFEWGYGGSGPAQLALALLLDFCGEEETALAHYQTFKAEFIATLPREVVRWRISGDEIAAFLHRRNPNLFSGG